MRETKVTLCILARATEKNDTASISDAGDYERVRFEVEKLSFVHEKSKMPVVDF